MFDPLTIGMFIVDLALVYHVFRSGRSPMWLAAIGLIGFSGFVLGSLALIAHFILWIAYVCFAVLPDFMRSHGMRRFAGNVAQAADPGRAYREKKRAAEQVGSVDAKRALAEESVKRGLYGEAIALYDEAMQGPLGANDPVLLKGLGRARMLMGEGAAAETVFLKLKAEDPAAFDADVELDFARALEMQGKNDAAVRQYEAVVTRYPGEEARCRFALLLEKMGQDAKAQAVFREIVASVEDAPGHYRSRQGEWLKIARQHLRN